MKRFMYLAIVLLLAGVALAVYAVLFGPKDAKNAMTDHKNPVGQIQYTKPLPPQQSNVQSGSTQPAAQPENK